MMADEAIGYLAANASGAGLASARAVG
jgi:hypothetical protein